ncbi:MAG: methyltransferase domain-containing protein [Holosporales bacterium]
MKFFSKKQKFRVSYQETPIIINNFNRVSCTKHLVQWLLNAGHEKIIILDNMSTYQELIDYYNEIKNNSFVRVIFLNKNYGHTALWECGLFTELTDNKPFVYTDSDVYPDETCPKDLLYYLAWALRLDNTIEKAGPALRIDNIQENNQHKNDIINWESQFWGTPTARGLFLAAIDTTFALYRGGSQYPSKNAIRTSYPYRAIHESWYHDLSNPSKELAYYIQHSRKDISNWTHQKLQPYILDKTSQVLRENKKFVHLGCGNDYFPGWINIDTGENKADIVFDLNTCRSNRLPLLDNSVHAFYGCHFFEHITDTLALMQELWRIAIPGAQLLFRVPYGASNDAMEDPTHSRPLFENNFVYFGQPAYSRADYGYTGDWKIEKISLVVPNKYKDVSLDDLALKVKHERNHVDEMLVYLKAIKPSRKREYTLLEWPSVEYQFSPLQKTFTVNQ